MDNHADLGLRKLEYLSELSSNRMWRLRSRPDGHLAGLDQRHADVRLKRDVLNRWAAEAVLEDVRGLAEALVDIAFAQLEMIQPVAALVSVQDDVRVYRAALRRPTLVQDWSTRLQRGLGLKDSR